MRAIRKLLLCLFSQLEGETGFANSAQPAQGQQPTAGIGQHST
jgi:hypothetical protein